MSDETPEPVVLDVHDGVLGGTAEDTDDSNDD